MTGPGNSNTPIFALFVKMELPPIFPMISGSTACYVASDRLPALPQRDAILLIMRQVPPGLPRVLAFPPARLYCQVQTLVFGRAIARATSPERFIVGCAAPPAELPEAFREFLDAYACPIL